MKRYNSLNGIRMFACIGIVLMHILTNGEYSINKTATQIITKFTNFVFLFMMLSSFSLFCGYFERFKTNTITIEEFYSKRINRILPFFFFLVIVDVLIEHNVSSLIEGFADITLLFGFIPTSLHVIGVGWFIGIIFIFYLMFPFFIYMFSLYKRAWLFTVLAFLMNLSCIYYFNVERTNMFFCFIFFCVGGLIFLYKDYIIKLLNKNRVVSLFFLIVACICFFIQINNKLINTIQILWFSIVVISYGISFESLLLDNKVTLFISKISLNIYLSHMFIYRILERISLNNIFDNEYLSYILTCIIVLIGTIVLSILFDCGIIIFKRRFLKNENTTSQ